LGRSPTGCSRSAAASASWPTRFRAAVHRQGSAGRGAPK
jgi:hypothetical protein